MALDNMTEAQKQELADAFKRFVAAITGNPTECIHCKRLIEKLEQVGRCVYARPCGCRQYQGKLRKEKKDHGA